MSCSTSFITFYDYTDRSFSFFSDRLYFATLKTGYKPKPTRNSKYFHIEDEIVYENFYFDFGPYHLCHLYQFCNKLTEELEKNPKKKIVFYTSNNETLRLNAAYLIGSYQVFIVYLFFGDVLIIAYGFLDAQKIGVWDVSTKNTMLPCDFSPLGIHGVSWMRP